MAFVFRWVFFRDYEMVSWSVISVPCYLMAMVLANFAFRYVSVLFPDDVC